MKRLKKVMLSMIDSLLSYVSVAFFALAIIKTFLYVLGIDL